MKTGDERTITLIMPGIDGVERIHFIYVGGVGYVSETNIVTKKSYEYLNEHGYIKGNKLTLSNGESFICRILTTLEWDEIIKFNDDDLLWHWSEGRSWVYSDDLESSGADLAFVRGGIEPNAIHLNDKFTKHENYGFRPVLIPVKSNQERKGYSLKSNCEQSCYKRIWHYKDFDKRVHCYNCTNNEDCETKTSIEPNALWIGQADAKEFFENLLFILSSELCENVEKLNKCQGFEFALENGRLYDYIKILRLSLSTLGVGTNSCFSMDKNGCTYVPEHHIDKQEQMYNRYVVKHTKGFI